MRVIPREDTLENSTILHLPLEKGATREGLHTLIHFLADATPPDLVYFSNVFIGLSFPLKLLHEVCLAKNGIRCESMEFDVLLGGYNRYGSVEEVDGYWSLISSYKDTFRLSSISRVAFLHLLLNQPLGGWTKGSGGLYAEYATVGFHLCEHYEDILVGDLLQRGGHFCRSRLLVEWETSIAEMRENVKEMRWLDVGVM